MLLYVAYFMFTDVYAATDSITEFPITINANYKESETETMYIKPTIGANVRQFAVLESNKVGALPYNTEIEVLYTTTTGWSAVIYEGRLRYIYSDCLSTEKMPPLVTNKSISVNNSSNVSESDDLNVESSSGTYLGQFKITYYCNCSQCCGQWAGGATASGTMPQAGRTIAVDRNVIPLGSKVLINGNVYVAEDVGGGIKGNRIDMYVSSHSEAMNRGVSYADVYLQ